MTPKSSRRKYLAIALACVLLLPLTARADVAQIIQLLVTITNTLKGEIGQVLSGIQKVNSERQSLQQELVWPLTAINQAKASVLQVRSRFSSLASQIHSIEVSSATLANPQQLELTLRSSQNGSVGGIQLAYLKIYGAVPSETEAVANDRNLMDIDDAMAAGSLKTATISGRVSEQMLSVADSIEQQASQTSPGAAPLLTVQAQVANLQNQAFLQKMLAAELRQEATRLAHDNSMLKSGAEADRNLRNNMQQILSRP
jgi:hypothetical protein